jgi:hypothetical protein
MSSLISTLSITTEFRSGHVASVFCGGSLALSIVLGYFVFRPFGWQHLLDRLSLFLVTGGALLTIAIGDLPDALPGTFERYLGHSLYQMVYRQEGPGSTFGELWINSWQDGTATLFECLVLAAVLLAIVNLFRRRAVRVNTIALCVAFGWVCLVLWAAASMVI